MAQTTPKTKRPAPTLSADSLTLFDLPESSPVKDTARKPPIKRPSKAAEDEGAKSPLSSAEAKTAVKAEGTRKRPSEMPSPSDASEVKPKRAKPQASAKPVIAPGSAANGNVKRKPKASPLAVKAPNQPTPNPSVENAPTRPSREEKQLTPSERRKPFLPFRGYLTRCDEGCEVEVRAKNGTFYPYDRETVAFYCRDLALARKICRKWNDQVHVFVQGDEETTLHLPARLYPEVASLIGLARKSA